MIKNIKNKMTTNSQLSINEPKNKHKNKVSKQLEQEQNQRNGDQQGRGKGRMGENVQGRGSMFSRHKVDRER